jgi:hypothetical protein
MLSRSPLATVTAFLLILGTSACSVPLAPGYRIVQEFREVRFVPGPPPHIQIAARYTFENSGTTDLEFIDVVFPEEKTYGRKDFRVEVDGRETRLAPLPEQYQPAAPNALRIPFDPVWKRGQKHEFLVTYAFSSPEDSGARITIGEDDFHLGSRGWAPLPQPPKHLLSPYPNRPARMIYTVRVPSDFKVLGGGQFRGRKQSAAESQYRFELRSHDMTPAIAAGRYVASSPEAKSRSAIFWTRQPLQEDPQIAAARIMAAWNVLEQDFGPLDKNIPAPHILESQGLREHVSGERGPSAVSFPGGVLVNSPLLSAGIGSDRFLEPVTHALAHDWFGNQVFFSHYSALGLGEGLPEYATVVVEEAANGDAGRRRRIRAYLREYDQARSGAEETPLGVTSLTDSPAQRRISLAKAPLFFIALEDFCGQGPMRGGLKRIVTLLRGQEIDYDSVRSALERSSGKNLADLFRVWLNEKDLPADFRSRYGQGAAAASSP